MSRNIPYEIRAKEILLARIERGEIPLGCVIFSTDPAISHIMANAGFDWLMIDTEHAKLDLSHIENHVRSARLGGTIPLVRIGDKSDHFVQAVLDAGAEGVIVPHMETAESARSIIDVSRYPPKGSRGQGPLTLGGGFDFEDWHRQKHDINDNVLVIPLIESVRGVDNIEQIVAVDGIDFILFGPADLALELGLDHSTAGNSPEIRAAYENVSQATRRHGKKLITTHEYGPSHDADMMLVNADFIHIKRGALSAIATVRGQLSGMVSARAE